ncbi:hypothetical protein [Nocardia veterana]|uniref:hypothetical protein n=1 Tax=Nocardia veterana TaxID=132249 RepID=UPI000687BF12|nr:hypothetical protein [Nocardia veterana]
MTSEPENTDGRGTLRRPATFAAALVVIVLIVVTGVIVLIGRHSGSNPDAAKTSSPTTTAPTTAPASSATGFTTPDVDVFGRRVDVPANPAGQPLEQTAPQRRPDDPQWLTAAPAGTRGPDAKGGWQRVHGAVVPFSTSDGPTHIQDGVPVGYAHTPQGAALAAAFVMWQTRARLGDRPLREHMVVMSAADFAQFDRLKAQGKAPDTQPEQVTRYMVAPDAFRITSWSDDMCQVALAVRQGSDTGAPRWTSLTLAMVWDQNEWKLRLPADKMIPQQTVTSIGGWTAW